METLPPCKSVQHTIFVQVMKYVVNISFCELSREKEPGGIVHECMDPNNKLLFEQAHEGYKTKEPLSMFIEFLAGKEMNRRLLQTGGIEKGWTCGSLCVETPVSSHITICLLLYRNTFSDVLYDAFTAP